MSLEGYWEFPGGKVQENERPEEALFREIKEELKIDIQVLRFVASNQHDYDNIQVNLQCYLSIWISGDLELVEHEEVRFLTLDELTEISLAPADVPIVNALRSLSIFI